MKPESVESFRALEKSLDDLIKIYRHLLGVVRREKEILVSANLQDLNENNKTKEAMLIKARQLEEFRMAATKSFARSEGISDESKLIDIAQFVGGETGLRLQNIQSVLELLLKRVKEHNVQNEVLVNAALENISGAMNSIREVISEKPTYKKSGSMKNHTREPGKLVSKEA